VGVGVDVHPFASGASGRELNLAGLHWPDEIGLEGHSDGDAAAHAACDALLSAAGLGDLGRLFGTSDPRWAGASGAALLEETARQVRAAGYEIGNVAIQVIGNRPKLAPRRAEAEKALSAALGAPGERLRDHDRRARAHRARRGHRGHRDRIGSQPFRIARRPFSGIREGVLAGRRLARLIRRRRFVTGAVRTAAFPHGLFVLLGG
jgi:2-C-methyl-D-erythritol 2,4-cyclodiphosphate synthase